MRQYRGCSRLYYALMTEGSDGSVTYGTPKQLAPVKSVSREISSDNEKVYADNVLQQTTFSATSISRSFDTTRIDPAVVAELLGDDAINVKTGVNAYATTPDGSSRPYFAILYALHDGDPETPVEVVVAYRCQCESISKASNTIDDGTGSEGQTVTITCSAPKNAWTQTGKKNLDLKLPIDAENADMVDKFFAEVVTPDNASNVLA